MIYTDDKDLIKNNEYNYMYEYEKNEYMMILHNYKTNKTFGTKKIILGEDLNIIVSKYIEILKRKDYIKSNMLFYNTKLKPINANGLTKMFIRLFKKEFNKNISTSMLRHIYLSNKYGENLKDRTKDSHNMGHNLKQQENYIKF